MLFKPLTPHALYLSSTEEAVFALLLHNNKRWRSIIPLCRPSETGSTCRLLASFGGAEPSHTQTMKSYRSPLRAKCHSNSESDRSSQPESAYTHFFLLLSGVITLWLTLVWNAGKISPRTSRNVTTLQGVGWLGSFWGFFWSWTSRWTTNIHLTFYKNLNSTPKVSEQVTDEHESRR